MTSPIKPKVMAIVVPVSAVALLAGCGSSAGAPAVPAGTASPSAEVAPSGDIPDSIAYVSYQAPSGAYSIRVPEGWSRTAAGDALSFTDKLNRVQVTLRSSPAAPTEATIRLREAPAAAATFPSAGPVTGVSTVQRSAGSAVVAQFQASSAPDPVTGKVVRDAVERYSFWKAGTEAVITLSGPVGADNVDPYKTITDSFRWRR